MTTRTHYEWILETIECDPDDPGNEELHDVIDIVHADSLYALIKAVRYVSPDQRVAVVRDIWVNESLEDRTWAYVINGELDEYFRDAHGSPGAAVPVRFRRGLAAYRDTAGEQAALDLSLQLG